MFTFVFLDKNPKPGLEYFTKNLWVSMSIIPCQYP